MEYILQADFRKQYKQNCYANVVSAAVRVRAHLGVCAGLYSHTKGLKVKRQQSHHFRSSFPRTHTHTHTPRVTSILNEIMRKLSDEQHKLDDTAHTGFELLFVLKPMPHCVKQTQVLPIVSCLYDFFSSSYIMLPPPRRGSLLSLHYSDL